MRNSRTRLAVIMLVIVLLAGILLLIAPIGAVDQLLLGYHTLEIRIPSEVFEGYNGWAQVWISYPGGELRKHVLVQTGEDVVIDVRLDLEDLGRRASEALAVMKDKYGTGEFAGVYVFMWLIDDEGDSCIMTLEYNTFLYLVRKLKDPSRAWKEATRDPLLLLKLDEVVLEEGNLARISKCINVEDNLDYIISAGRSTVNPEVGGLNSKRAGISEFETIPIDSDYGAIEASAESEERSCTLDHVEVYNQMLYNASDTPPDEWYDRVELVAGYESRRDAIIGGLWDTFVEILSAAYYFSSECSVDSVVEAVSRYTGIYAGLYSMDELIRKLAEITGWSYTVRGWRDLYDYGTIVKHYDLAPLIAVELACASKDCYEFPGGPTVIVDIDVAPGSYEAIGIGLFGKLIMGRQVFAYNFTDEMLVMTPMMDGKASYKGYLAAPLDVIYNYDSFVLLYDIDYVVVQGQRYWRVVPLFAFIPYYSVEYSYNSIQLVRGVSSDAVGSLSEIYHELVSSCNDTDAIIDYVLSEGRLTSSSEAKTVDSNMNEDIESTGIGGLMIPLSNMIASRLFLGVMDSQYAKYSSLPAASVNIILASVNSDIIQIEFTLDQSTITHPAYVRIIKKSLNEAYLNEAYRVAGYRPLTIVYIVIYEHQK